MSIRLVGVLGIVACAGVPDAPAHLERVASSSDLSPGTQLAFDAGDSLVLMDDSVGLRRLVGVRLDIIPGSEAFRSGSIGVDRDGTLLVGSFATSTLARLTGDATAPVGPPATSLFVAPVGTPSGNYYVRSDLQDLTFVLAPGTTGWIESPLDLTRTLRGRDGTLFAIIDGDIVRLAAGDTIVPIASCAMFGGSTCPRLALGGTDAEGLLYMAAPGFETIGILDPVGGGLRELDLPGNLRAETIAAGARMVVLVASDPDRADAKSLWLLRGSELSRIGAIGFVKLIADNAGAVYVVGDGTLEAVVLD